MLIYFLLESTTRTNEMLHRKGHIQFFLRFHPKNIMDVRFQYQMLHVPTQKYFWLVTRPHFQRELEAVKKRARVW